MIPFLFGVCIGAVFGMFAMAMAIAADEDRDSP